MIKRIDTCVRCPTELGCRTPCPYSESVAIFCDVCGQEYDEEDVRLIDGECICKDCYLEKCENEFENSPRISLEDYDD